MRWFGAVAVALASCHAQQGAPKQVTSEGDPQPLVTVSARLDVSLREPSLEAIAADDVVVSRTNKELHAYGLDGTRRWSAPFAGGAPLRMQPFSPGRLAVHADDHLLLFDTKSGAAVAEREGLHSGMRFEVSNGACLAYDSCDIQLLDCSDGHLYGPRLQVGVWHIYQSVGKPHDNVCRGPRLLLGRANDLVVAVTDGYTWEKQAGPITVAFDANGKTVWTSRAHGCEMCLPTASGMSGDTCWITDVKGHLDVFSCRTGKSRFKRDLAPLEGTPAIYTEWASGIFVSDAKGARLLDEKSGATRWSLPLPKNGLALPLGIDLDLPKYMSWTDHTIVLVKGGKEVRRFDLPGYTEIEARDGDVQLVQPGTFTLERSKLPRALRANGEDVLTVATDLEIVAQMKDNAAIYVWGRDKESGELLVVGLR